MFNDPKTTWTGIIGAVALIVKTIFKIEIPSEPIVAIIIFCIGMFSKDTTKPA